MENQKASLKALSSLSHIRNLSTFIVGGTIRDLLRGQKTNDLDILVFGDVWRTAAELAQALEATWFVLDESSRTARVVLTGNRNLHLDLVGAGHQSLLENLQERDFTLNAMAVSLPDYLEYLEKPDYPLNGALIDPLKGKQDLEDRMLRVTSDQAFKHDPLRLLRAIRLAATLDLQVEKGTLALITQQARLITQSTSERIRDELFKILAVDKTYFWIKQLERLGLLGVIFPELEALKGVEQNKYHALDVWGHSLATLKQLEQKLWQKWLPSDLEEHVESYLSESLGATRTRWQLLKLGALLHDMGKPEVKATRHGGKIIFYGHEQAGARQARRIAERLKLSNQEKRGLTTLVDQHMRPFHLFRAENHTGKAEYRFYLKTGSEAVAILLLALADRAAGRALDSDAEPLRFSHFIKRLLERYYYEFQTARNQRLIGGQDVLQAFGLKPGPLVGKILKQVEEAQVLGRIHTREEALQFVGQILRRSRIII
ncbi:MAG: HDIG domain-containing protein [Syntrophomonadaceae bacterium]|nr:HDIG domain-containing protein [Syntrophomonadaceae bacterium]